MTDSKAYYRKLRHYKYQLMQDYTISIEIETEEDIETSFIVLTTDGELTIKNRYAWDGPSGPTADTKSFMRGSLVHDALYQLKREGYLDHQEHPECADDLLKKICLEDGMSRVRAWYVHKSVRTFAEKHARPSPKPRDQIICVP
jgi:hypothetical protein